MSSSLIFLPILFASAAALHATPSIADLAALSSSAEQLGSLYEKEIKGQPSAAEQRESLSLENAAELGELVCHAHIGVEARASFCSGVCLAGC